MYRFMAIFLGFVLLVINACPKPVDIEVEKKRVKAILERLVQVYESEDLELLSKIFADEVDMVIFGTDTAQHWIGLDSFQEAQREYFKSVEGSDLSIRDEVVKIHKSGKVAWVSGLLDYRGVVEGEVFSVEGMRFTLVLEKRYQNWVIVHWHTSLPHVPGQ